VLNGIFVSVFSVSFICSFYARLTVIHFAYYVRTVVVSTFITSWSRVYWPCVRPSFVTFWDHPISITSQWPVLLSVFRIPFSVLVVHMRTACC